MKHANIVKSIFAAVALLPAAGVWADSETVNGYTWTYRINGDTAEIYNNGSCVVSPSPTGALTIPSTLGGKPVKSIGFCAFYGCSGLTSVTIPDSVTSIGTDAFGYCRSLTSVTIGSSVRGIGSCAFVGCSRDLFDTTTIPGAKLVDGWVVGSSDDIPRSLNLKDVRGIQDCAFEECSALTNVTIDSVAHIGFLAFHECDSLTSVTINNVTCNWDLAFRRCSALTRVTIGNGVTSIGGCAFEECSALTRVTIGSGVTSIGTDAFEGCSDTLFDTTTIHGVRLVDGWAVGYTSEIPRNLNLTGARGIGDAAFDGCRALEYVTIPVDVTCIGEDAFDNCSSMASFVVAEGNPNYKSVSGLLLTKGGKTLIRGVNGDVTIPSSVTIIGPSAFYNCSGLTSVTIPNSVMDIMHHAFAGCSSLTSVTIPDSVTSIGNLAFNKCSGLTRVTIPSGVSNIGMKAFCGCSRLTSIAMLDSVTSIGECAFEDCGGLTSVLFLGNAPTDVGSDAFSKVATDCTSYVHKGSTGWGVDIPGTWNGMRIVYIEDEPPPVPVPAPTPVACTATFNANGGAVSPTTRAVTRGTAVGALPTPTRSGYSFVGWFTEKSGGAQVYAATVVAGDVTYYAHWTVNQYTVTFNANGGTGGTTKTQDYGTSLTAPTVTRTGYTFTGWSPAVPATVPAGNITYTAQWRINRYSVSLNLNGGAGAGSATVNYGTMVGDIPVPTREWYAFAGWFTAAEGGERVDDATAITSPIELYARWTRTHYVVNFNANGGKSSEAKRPVPVSSAIGDLPIATRNGYMLLGWFTANDGGDRIDASTIIDGDVTFCAHWLSNNEIIINTAELYETSTDGSFDLVLSNLVLSASTPKFTLKGLPTGLKYDAKTLKISGKATKPGVYKVTVSATNATVKKPVTATFELIVPNLVSEKLPGLMPETDAYGIVQCGVAFNPELVDCTAEEGWTVKAAGLPTGLKWDAKSGTIVGVPTKAGTNTVTFTASKKGEKSEVATITLVTAALPAWAQGTFTGYVRLYGGEPDYEDDLGLATMTVGANGKVSGKISLCGTNWTFAAASYATSDGDDYFEVSAEAKAGKATKPVWIQVSGSAGAGELQNATAEGWLGGYLVAPVSMRRNMWKDKATASAAKEEIAGWMGLYTLSLEDGGYMSLNVGKDGTVKSAGKLADGTGVSASSPLMHDVDNGWFAYVYAAPSAYKGGAFALSVGFEGDRRDEVIAPYLATVVLTNSIGISQWSSRNPQATGEYGAGFVRHPEFRGAYYDKAKKLNEFYAARRFDLESLPVLNISRKVTYLDEYGKKKTVSVADEAYAADTFAQPGLVAAVNGKGAFVVEKATKPVQDKETKEWSYAGANDGALTLSFAQATGIFKGSYTLWYDYASAEDETTGKTTSAHVSKKVSFEGVMVQGSDEMRGFYLWDASSSYMDEKTGKEKAYKYKESFPVRLAR